MGARASRTARGQGAGGGAAEASGGVTVFVDIAQLVTAAPGAVVPAGEGPLGVISNAAVIAEGPPGAQRIRWVGPRRGLPVSLAGAPAAGRPGEASAWSEAAEPRIVSLEGRVVMPGLVDAHTHLVFAGDRAADFAARCAGESYEAIAARGGGIATTVRATREADEGELAALARPRLDELLAHGVTTVEVKSGYGLNAATELRLLRVIEALAGEGPQRIVPTFLGAHVVPPERAGDREGYVRDLVDDLLPQVAARGLARHVDVFCEVGAFSLDETVRVLERGRALGLGLKVHAEQLTRTGAAAAAARLGAVSADHLEHASPEDVAALARAGTAAVLLPGAGLFLGGRDRAPARQLLDAGVPVALATDCNPGTCPSAHLPLMVSLGCTWLGMRPDEALLGVTRSAAWAVGLRDGTGTIAPGAPCDLVALNVPAWTHVPYRMGHNPVEAVWIGGALAHRRGAPERPLRRAAG